MPMWSAMATDQGVAAALVLWERSVQEAETVFAGKVDARDCAHCLVHGGTRISRIFKRARPPSSRFAPLVLRELAPRLVQKSLYFVFFAFTPYICKRFIHNI